MLNPPLDCQIFATDSYYQTITTSPQSCVDIFFIHGFGDRVVYHTKLIDFLMASNLPLRFIGLDLPQHGTNRSLLNRLDFYSFKEVMLLLDWLEKFSRIKPSTPVLFIGYSLGGLITTRLLQRYLPKTNGLKERTIIGACLLSPAIATRLLMGRFGFFTRKTLAGLKYKPQMQYAVSAFGFRILSQAKKARSTPLPKNVPILIIVGDKSRDKYCKVEKIKKWALKNMQSSPNIMLQQIAHARHPIDNESEEITSTLFQTILDFIEKCRIIN